MVVLFLLVLWIAVLAPPLVVKIRERRTGESIESFHRQLHLLERTPKAVTPAFRLESAAPSMAGSSGFPSVSSMPGRPQLVLLGGDGAPVDGGSRTDLIVPRLSLHPPVPPAPLEVDRRSTQRRRRRDLVLFLLGVATVTGLGGMAFAPLWAITALSVVGLGAFLALAVYAEQLRVEQQRHARILRDQRAGTLDPSDQRGWAEGFESESLRAVAIR